MIESGILQEKREREAKREMGEEGGERERMRSLWVSQAYVRMADVIRWGVWKQKPIFLGIEHTHTHTYQKCVSENENEERNLTEQTCII